MAETIDDLTISYTEDGVEVTKELDKSVLTKGAWSTVMYKFQTWDAKKEEYTATKYTIRRYQKRNGEYVQKSKFNLSSVDQAQKVVDILTQWIGEEGADKAE